MTRERGTEKGISAGKLQKKKKKERVRRRESIRGKENKSLEVKKKTRES